MSMAMPVVPTEGEKPFGDKAMIFLGGYDKEAMRRWQERVRAAKATSAGPIYGDHDNGNEPGRTTHLRDINNEGHEG
jgi:hypothetical protein